MSPLAIAVLTAIAGFWLLAYLGVPLLAWTVAIGLYLAALVTGDLMTDAGTIRITGAVFVVVALLLNVPALRRLVLTGWIFGLFKKVLPDMTPTEREALESGTTWWEGEMFRGRPNWKQLIDFQRTK